MPEYDPPEPFCHDCYDAGQIEILHPSTDGLIGHRRCEQAACAERFRVLVEVAKRRQAAEDAADAAHRAVCAGTDCCPPF